MRSEFRRARSSPGLNPYYDDGHGAPAEAREVAYTCLRGHRTVRAFAADVPDPELPAEFDCGTCFQPARCEVAEAAQAGTGGAPGVKKAQKTPLDHLHERRTPEEGALILAAALRAVRARRGRPIG